MVTTSLREALVDRAAAQWAALGVALQAPREQAVVDLEALIGLTAALGADDPRVREGAAAWQRRFGRFVNEARLRRVVAEMGLSVDAVAGVWASAAPGGTGRELVIDRPDRSAARFAWSLRAAFGVNARSDLVAILATRPGQACTVLELARLARFGKRNVAIALDDLALAGVVERLEAGSVARYRLRDAAALIRWLDVRGACAYPDWVSEFTIGLALVAFLELPEASTRVRAIEARQVAASLRPAIDQAGLRGPDVGVTGPAFAGAFDEWVDALRGRWAGTA